MNTYFPDNAICPPKADAHDIIDLALTDIPYFQAEVYNPDDSRDLGNIKKIDYFL